MDFTPHTEADVALMLERIGLGEPADLFAHIPAGALLDHDPGLPGPLSELELMQMVEALGGRNRSELTCFAGGGYSSTISPRW